MEEKLINSLPARTRAYLKECQIFNDMDMEIDNSPSYIQKLVNQQDNRDYIYLNKPCNKKTSSYTSYEEATEYEM